MARKARINVPVPADSYPHLAEVAREVNRTAGVVAGELAELYGEDYIQRRLDADKAREDTEHRVLHTRTERTKT